MEPSQHSDFSLDLTRLKPPQRPLSEELRPVAQGMSGLEEQSNQREPGAELRVTTPFDKGSMPDAFTSASMGIPHTALEEDLPLKQARFVKELIGRGHSRSHIFRDQLQEAEKYACLICSTPEVRGEIVISRLELSRMEAAGVRFVARLRAETFVLDTLKRYGLDSVVISGKSALPKWVRLKPKKQPDGDLYGATSGFTGRIVLHFDLPSPGQTLLHALKWGGLPGQYEVLLHETIHRSCQRRHYAPGNLAVTLMQCGMILGNLVPLSAATYLAGTHYGFWAGVGAFWGVGYVLGKPLERLGKFVNHRSDDAVILRELHPREEERRCESNSELWNSDPHNLCAAVVNEYIAKRRIPSEHLPDQIFKKYPENAKRSLKACILMRGLRHLEVPLAEIGSMLSWDRWDGKMSTFPLLEARLQQARREWDLTDEADFGQYSDFVEGLMQLKKNAAEKVIRSIAFQEVMRELSAHADLELRSPLSEIPGPLFVFSED